MEKLRTGLIGLGKVSPTHAKALREIPESHFAAVFSRSKEKASSFAARYGEGVKGYDDLDEMLRREGLQAVIVCTPHPFHAKPAIRAARAGVHVLVEKPLAASLADCDAMIAAARESGVRLGTVSQRRWYEPARRVKRAIEEKRIGRPILGVATLLGWRDRAYYASDPWRGSWRMEGGGVLVNQSPHQLDLLLWYLGPIEELFGYWENLNHPYIEVEDTAVAVIRFRSGALGSVVVSNSQNPALYGRVHVHGSRGVSVGVQTDGGAMFIAGMTPITEPPLNDLWTIPGEEKSLEEWRREDTEFFKSIDAPTYYHGLQIRDFLQAILKDREPSVTGEDGRKTVELFTGLYRSQRDRAPVRFPLQPEEGRSDLDGRLSRTAD